MTCLVTFDIEDEDRRGQIVRYLERTGKRVAKTLFAVTLPRHHFRKFREEVEKLSTGEGTVVIIRLCNGCERAARTLAEKTDAFIVI